ncbi:MAG: excisionase [Candidatus Sedimenticola sp. (ex Thyasira tokunagai)]
MNWVTIKRFSELSGYTEKAIALKTARGVWVKNVHWTKSPDGRIHICISAVEAWIQGIAA